MSSAEKLLEGMTRTKSGWGQQDLERLYLGFGFEKRGSKHIIFVHPKYHQLMATVARHRTLAKGYISFAIKLIERLKRLEAGLEK